MVFCVMGFHPYFPWDVFLIIFIGSTHEELLFQSDLSQFYFQITDLQINAFKRTGKEGRRMSKLHVNERDQSIAM